MNYAPDNKRALEEIRRMSSSDWDDIPSAQRPARLAVKMEAALRLVLLFYSKQPWSTDCDIEWQNLQRAAGIDIPFECVTTKAMCNTIRYVLGEETT